MTVHVEGSPANMDVINVLHENYFEAGTLSWSSQDTDGQAANAVDDATWNFWTPTAVPATLQSDMGVATDADCCGITGHTMGSTGASIQVQYSSNGTTWTDATAVVSPLTDETIILFWPSVSARYWRIRMTGAVASIGVAKIGQRLAFPCAPVTSHVAIHHSHDVELMNNTSIGGQLLGNRVVRRGATADCNVGYVERDFAENQLIAFETDYNNGRAFFYASCPSVFPADMGYCWRPEGGDTMAVSWDEGDGLASVAFGMSVYLGE